MSSAALLFPGQGAQSVGMGRGLAEAYGAARETFEEARSRTGLDIETLCSSGPLEELSRSDVAQPAILTVSIAALRAMQEAAGAPPDACAAAGLSLGEYSALVAAGAMAFADAVCLVQRRGRYMQQACDAHPGAMYSIIGLEDGRVEQACAQAREQTGGGVWPANYNCPGQLVISGEHAPAEAAAALCSAMGARRAIRLNVAGAFHTPLMQPAADRLKADLDTVEVHLPQLTVLANVTGQAVSDPAEVRALLVRQITSPVRWQGCMRRLLERGITRYYEVGPGRVLRGLLRRIEPAATCTAVSGPADVQAYADAPAT